MPQTLSYLRGEYWVPQGRSFVKSVLHRCNPCRKVSGPFFPKPSHPPLPDIRVRQARAFESIGLDFVGPFVIKGTLLDVYKKWRTGNLKGLKKIKAKARDGKKLEKPKAYMLIFTCTSTRAVHLEATLGMNVDDFLMAFQRFNNVRGVPTTINSDNAKTFLRANKEFKSIFESSRVKNELRQNRILWHFYLERLPQQGGFIERLNHVFKDVCRKTFGRLLMSFDQFRTMVSYAMGVMNDRPLTYVYSDIDSAGTDISPSMLMHGHKLMEPPHLRWRKTKDPEEVKLGEQFVKVEKLKDSFWQKWHKEYHTALYERHTQQGKTPDHFLEPKENDVVLVREEKTPRRSWKLGRVLEVKRSDRDGKIREVKLVTVSGKPSGSAKRWEPKRTILRRSPSFLVPLEVGVESYVGVDAYTQKLKKETLKQPKKVVRFAAGG